MLAILATAPVAAQVTVRTQTGAHGPEVVLENNYLRVTVEPGFGARVMSLVYKPLGRELVAPLDRETSGLFMDCLGGEDWHADFAFAPYTYEIEQSGPEQAVVAFRCDNGGPRPSPMSQDLRLTKTLTLGANAKFLQADIRIENRGAKTKTPGYWSKHDLTVSGKLLADHYFRPGPQGPEQVYWDLDKKDRVGEDLLKQPVEGWTAAVDPDGSLGLVFLMDYNYLQWLYNCLPYSTVEWFYDRVAIPPGQAWETRLYAVAVEKIKQVSYASPNVIAATRFEDHRPDGIFFENEFHPSVVPLKSFWVYDDVEEYFTHKKSRIGGQKYPGSGGGVDTTFTPVPKDPILLHEVLEGETAAGQPVRDGYEVYYAGASQTGFVITAGGSPYKHPAPPQHKVFLKPEKIVWQPHQPRRLLYLAGLHHQQWGLLAAAEKLGYQVDIGTLATSFTGTVLSQFPGSYDEMLSYDTVVLTGIDANALADFGREMLRDFVKAGGTLIVTGGFYAYGEGGYGGTQFDDLLPFKVGGPFTLLPVTGDNRLQPQAGADLPSGLDWSAAPRCLWAHQVTALPGAHLLLTLAGKPFLAVRPVGQGRVIACAGSLLGEPKEGGLPFWEWKSWPLVAEGMLG
jgi:uncharacterized membrane protein